jgi:hypothetical protein
MLIVTIITLALYRDAESLVMALMGLDAGQRAYHPNTGSRLTLRTSGLACPNHRFWSSAGKSYPLQT